MSTFGLLGRGKGIEYVIRALPKVIKKYPQVQYLILGKTHPTVRRQEGESYRLELSELVTKLGLKKHVKFYDQYLDLDDLIEFLKATDIYISSSVNPNQAVSGTLSYALGTGRAVISTQFAQAKEIITPNVGILVPIKDSAAITTALLKLLRHKNKLKQMHQQAFAITRPMLWSNVAKEYADLLAQAVLPPINLRHLKKMTDSFGLLQFAKENTPHKEFGYTLDDNARALIVCNELILQKYRTAGLKKLVSIYLNFALACQRTDGTCINYLSHHGKKPTHQNTTEDVSEACARTFWATSAVMKNPYLNAKTKNTATQIFLRTLPHVHTYPHLRAKAYAIKSLFTVLESIPEKKPQLLALMNELASSLVNSLNAHTDNSWHWFEEHLIYNNALLPESLLIAGNVLKNDKYTQLGISSLQFLINQTFSTNMYVPIGHTNWYKHNQKRSYFDQQPEDPASMIMALTTAYELTHQESYKNLALKCFSWFLGNNSLHKSVYDFRTGGCYDGLHPDRINLNQGAESLVSYLFSRLAIAKLNLHENSTI